MDWLLGKTRSKIHSTAGTSTEVYTVLVPNSRPMSRKPSSSSPTLRMKVMTEMDRG